MSKQEWFRTRAHLYPPVSDFKSYVAINLNQIPALLDPGCNQPPKYCNLCPANRAADSLLPSRCLIN